MKKIILVSDIVDIWSKNGQSIVEIDCLIYRQRVSKIMFIEVMNACHETGFFEIPLYGGISKELCYEYTQETLEKIRFNMEFYNNCIDVIFCYYDIVYNKKRNPDFYGLYQKLEEYHKLIFEYEQEIDFEFNLN